MLVLVTAGSVGEQAGLRPRAQTPDAHELIAIIASGMMRVVVEWGGRHKNGIAPDIQGIQRRMLVP